MADNVTLNAGTGGSTLASDDIGGIQHQRVKLVLGADGTSNGDVALANPIPTLDGLAIARGVASTLSTIHKFGENTDVDTAAPEDLWEAPTTTWVAPTTARLHDIVSSSAADDGSPAGTGAWVVTVEGLDASGVFQTEDVTLNGIGAVSTANTYTMIHRMFVLTAGSGGENAGTITATAATDGTITAQIDPTLNQTHMAIYKVPAATTAYLVSWYGGHIGSTNADLDFQLLRLAPAANSVWRPVQVQGVMGSGNSHFRHDQLLPIAFPTGTIIKVRVTTSANNQGAFGGFDLVLAT